MQTDKFQIMLKGFEEIIDGYPAIDKVKNDLLELRQSAINESDLTDHQKCAITERCNNYINNDYGLQRKQTVQRSDYSKSLK